MRKTWTVLFKTLFVSSFFVLNLFLKSIRWFSKKVLCIKDISPGITKKKLSEIFYSQIFIFYQFAYSIIYIFYQFAYSIIYISYSIIHLFSCYLIICKFVIILIIQLFINLSCC